MDDGESVDASLTGKGVERTTRYARVFTQCRTRNAGLGRRRRAQQSLLGLSPKAARCRRGRVDDDEGVDASFAGRGCGGGTRDTRCSGCLPMQQRARRGKGNARRGGHVGDGERGGESDDDEVCAGCHPRQRGGGRGCCAGCHPRQRGGRRGRRGVATREGETARREAEAARREVGAMRKEVEALGRDVEALGRTAPQTQSPTGKVRRP